MKKSLRLALPLVLVSAVLSACSTGGGTDITNPTVALVNLPTTVTQSSAVTIAVQANDDRGIKSVEFYVDGKLVKTVTEAPYQTSYSWTVAANGPHVIKVVATDTSGNQAEASQTVTVAISDVSKPVATISGMPTTTITAAGTFTANVSATDDVGVVKLRAVLTLTTPAGTTTTLRDETTTTATSLSLPVAVDDAHNGTYTLLVTATDAAGNVGTTSQSVVVNIPPVVVPDTTKPEVTITGMPTATVTTAGTITPTVSATDNVGVVSVRAVLTLTTPAGITTLRDDTTASSSLSIPVTLDSTRNGTYTLTVTATDAAGNVGTATQSVVVNIPTVVIPGGDKTKPVVTISGMPTTTITKAGTLTPSVTATDDVGVVYLRAVLTLTNAGGTTTLVDQYSNNATSFSFPTPIDWTRNGTYTLTVTANDAAGNVGTATQSAVVNIQNPANDTEKPTMTITLPPSPITKEGAYNVVVATSDNVAVVSLTGYIDTPFLGRISLGNLQPEGGVVPVNVVKGMNGTSVVTFTATDAAGNSLTQSASMTVAIP